MLKRLKDSIHSLPKQIYPVGVSFWPLTLSVKIRLLYPNSMERVSLKRRYKVSVLLFAFLLSSLPVKVNAAVPDDTVTIATLSPLNTLNPYSINAGELNREIKTLTSMGFNYWNKDLQKVQNSQFGSYTVLTTSPLAVRFTVRSGARWSDGTPITAVDLLFSHLISSSAFAESAGLIAGTNPNPTFDSTNYFNFYDRAISQSPQLSSDKQSMTLTFSNSFPDWEMFTPTPFPVHALALLTRGASGLQSLATNLVYKNEFESAFMSRNTSVLKSYANAFNSLYSLTEVNQRTNPLILVTNGPYMLDMADKLVVKLKKNSNYNSGPALSGIDSIIYKILPMGQDIQAAAKNGDVDIAQGSITQESVDFFKGITQNKFVSYDTSIFEHLDLRVGASLPGETYLGPFAGNSSKAKDLRKAFLLAFPRQEILDKVIKPTAPHAILPTSFLRMEPERGHDEIAIRSGFLARYSADDIARQEAALKIVKTYFPTASATTPMVDVKILYGANNTRREAVIQLAKTALAKAGFNLIPDKQASWSAQLQSSKHDAYLFAWATNFQGNSQIGGQIPHRNYCSTCNYLGYSNQIVDQNYTVLNSNQFNWQGYTNMLERVRAHSQIESELVSDAISIPLFRHPASFSVSGNLINFKPTALTEGYLWNFWEWKKIGTVSLKTSLTKIVDGINSSNNLTDALNALTDSSDSLNASIEDATDSQSLALSRVFSSEFTSIEDKMSVNSKALNQLRLIEESVCLEIENLTSNSDEYNAAMDACAEFKDALNYAEDSYFATEEALNLAAEQLIRYESSKIPKLSLTQIFTYTDRSNRLLENLSALTISTEAISAKIGDSIVARSFSGAITYSQQISNLKSALQQYSQELDDLLATNASCDFIYANESNTLESNTAIRACTDFNDVVIDTISEFGDASSGTLDAEAQFAKFETAQAADPKAVADAKAAADLKAKQEADAKAAADLKAKQEADAKAAADLKAKQEADAKAAAALRAQLEADAKAAADLKAKQEADAKAAAEKAAADLKAKQDADTKAAAAKAAADKAAAAKAAAAKAKKSPTVTCKKGSIVKVFVGKQCPPGYKK